MDYTTGNISNKETNVAVALLTDNGIKDAAELIDKYMLAAKKYGSPLLLMEAAYAISDLAEDTGSGVLKQMPKKNYLLSIIEKAKESFEAVHEFKIADDGATACHIYAFNAFEDVTAQPLFFLALSKKVKCDSLFILLKDLDAAYGDTDQNLEDWAPEFQLWARMLLDSEHPALMLNPQYLQVKDNDGLFLQEALLPFLRDIGEDDKLYERLINEVDAINKIFEAEDYPLSFDYPVENEEGDA